MFNRKFPNTQMRRLRSAPWVRDLVAEHGLQASDLIYPMFVREKESPREIKTLPGVYRHTEDELLKTCEEAINLGIQAVALFPYIEASLKDARGKMAIEGDNLMCRMIQLIKENFGSELGIVADVALDPYTSHGHDGVIKSHRVDNIETTEMLVKQALVQAQAGADIIAPSDMMDGRIGMIRKSLDQEGFEHVILMSYAAKYASAFYGPFRDAVGAGSPGSFLGAPLDKKTYQMDSRNVLEALHECALDLEEGADMLMVKPGMPYLDIVYRVKETFKVPTFVYQVSGEFSMIKLAAQHAGMDYAKTLLESLIAFKRAGADGIFTYGALDALKILKD